jgi:hypothetical protein
VADEKACAPLIKRSPRLEFAADSGCTCSPLMDLSIDAWSVGHSFAAMRMTLRWPSSIIRLTARWLISNGVFISDESGGLAVLQIRCFGRFEDV